MSRYYVHDLEEDKLHLHTAGKADFQRLPEELKKAIKGSFVWSGARGCWLGRRKGRFAWCLDKLKAAGFEDRGEQGERLSFAEQVETSEQKAAARAERMEDRAERAEKEARQRFNAAHAATAMIPMGQPILIGHHSEGRHRAALRRSDNNMRAGCEALDKAKHYDSRAEAAAYNASGEKWTDPAYIGNRIEEAEALEREYLRRQEKYGHTYAEELAQVREKLEFCRAKLAATGHSWNRENLKGMKFVKVRGRWEEVVRLNPKTVSVLNGCFPTRESQAKWPLKYAYTSIQDARPAEAPKVEPTAQETPGTLFAEEAGR